MMKDSEKLTVARLLTAIERFEAVNAPRMGKLGDLVRDQSRHEQEFASAKAKLAESIEAARLLIG